MNDGVVWSHVVAGGIGGLAAIIMKNGYIELPRVRDYRIYVGSFGGIVISMIAGWIGNTTEINAFMWGLGGTTILRGLLEKTGMESRIELVGRKGGAWVSSHVSRDKGKRKNTK